MLKLCDNEQQMQVYIPDSIQLSNENGSPSITSSDFMKSIFTHPKPLIKEETDNFYQPVSVLAKNRDLPDRVGRKNRRHGLKTKARVNKYCKTLGCGNIAVSRELCRSHGGGRRCHFVGCAKGAQSRSIFCWAHGGGCRCEVKGCMRSRKSKHFCVDHVNLEDTTSAATKLPKNGIATTDSPRLPSLQEALRKAQRSDNHRRQTIRVKFVWEWTAKTHENVAVTLLHRDHAIVS
ncbi:hypothetical protein PHPALM_28905 [Phytophthora palmivora]|uniref:WRKY19-like zinc finger domain-containing protein n=1 Tax=Phytophthora palmivora TaxID=4796 RepID=A0A2P4X8W8_9STRA|nr:hypothetical protein PHPALM_28905 [Phytophthora palmivora]